MCDNDSMDDMIEYRLRSAALSRREFGALTVGAGVASVLSPVANAAEVKGSDVDIKTPDGTCDAYFVHPAKGKGAGVLVWPDIFGLRPAFKKMADRLAESGYSVLVINPFYRAKHAPTAPEKPDFNDPETRKALFALAGGLNVQTTETDAKALIGWLDSQNTVDKKRKMGTTGYCMGGPLMMRTAAAFPDRVGGGCSFHGGNLVTDKPDSPHLLVPKMNGSYLFAIAANDDMRDPKAKDVLRKTFDDAHGHAKAEIEVYTGTMHGWCPTDAAVYNHEMAEKAWTRQLATFKTALA